MAFLAVGYFRERAVLSAALSGTGRHAASYPGLRDPIYRLEHDLFDRRLRVRDLATAVSVRHLEVCAWRRGGWQPSMGRRSRTRVGAALTCPTSLMGDTAVCCGRGTGGGALIGAPGAWRML